MFGIPGQIIPYRDRPFHDNLRACAELIPQGKATFMNAPYFLTKYRFITENIRYFYMKLSELYL